MPRKEDEPIIRLHVNLFEEDVDWLRQMYGQEHSVGMGKAIRRMVRNSIKRMKEIQAAKSRAIEPLGESEMDSLVEEAGGQQ